MTQMPLPPNSFPPGPDGRTYLMPHRGTMILVLGILSLVVCAFLGIPALLMANTDLRAMREGRMDPSGEGITTAGKVLGIIGTVFAAIGLIGGCIYGLFVVIFIGAAAAGAAQGHP